MTYYIILFIIIFNNILLNLLIALIYYLAPDSLPFSYTKTYLSIIRNWFSFIALLKSILICHLIAVLISIYQYPIC